MVKKGDTLIEVTLAVGIFSMIAIAVVAVMSGGTSSAQSALETTLAREEIDTQAEALRFIQSAYVADKDNQNSNYYKLWNAITENANTLNGTDDDVNILQFTPNNCSDLYNPNSGIVTQNAFVINPRKLSNFDNVEEAYISIKGEFNSSKFAEAQTYPHLIYGKDGGNSDNTTLTDTNIDSSLYRAEGIYVVAVKDKSTTYIADDDNKENPQNTSAFYDFYIRTCWYGTDAERPSTISTVIRLYDPNIIKAETPEEPAPNPGD